MKVLLSNPSHWGRRKRQVIWQMHNAFKVLLSHFYVLHIKPEAKGIAV